jgi:hypothetical protein
MVTRELMESFDVSHPNDQIDKACNGGGPDGRQDRHRARRRRDSGRNDRHLLGGAAKRDSTRCREPKRVYHANGYVEKAAELINEEAVQLAGSRVKVSIEMISEDNAVVFTASQGNFELNAMSPIIINNLHSARVLGDACDKFRRISMERTRLNRQRIDKMLDSSLVLVTALSPAIGYDEAPEIAHKTNDENLTLKEAALRSGFIDEKSRVNEIVDPTKMVGDGSEVR